MRVLLTTYFAGRITSKQEIKHEIKRDRKGNTSVTGVTKEAVDPNNSILINEIIQVIQVYCLLIL